MRNKPSPESLRVGDHVVVAASETVLFKSYTVFRVCGLTPLETGVTRINLLSPTAVATDWTKNCSDAGVCLYAPTEELSQTKFVVCATDHARVILARS